jgi:hypothetical protein
MLVSLAGCEIAVLLIQIALFEMDEMPSVLSAKPLV